MNREIDTATIERCIRDIIVALGDDPEREGLKDTPIRVANMYAQVFEGMKYSNEEIAAMFDKTFHDEDYIHSEDKNLVVVKDIPIFSYCEHHIALMYNMTVSVVYQPKDRIIGLSKIARIADMVGRRLQLQERIGNDIADIISIITGTEDVGVLVKGEHSCMTARGIQKPGTSTVTTTFNGCFKTDDVLRQEAILLLQ